jgi:hypothetical protein
VSELDYYDRHVNKLDQIILGQLRCLTLSSVTTVRTHKIQTERKQATTKFLLKGLPVCKNTFLFAHQIKRFKHLTKMYNSTGLIAKEQVKMLKMLQVFLAYRMLLDF